MSGLQRKQPDTDHQNQDKGSDSESADTEKKQEISDTQTSPQTPSMSPIRKALQLFPCCCGKRPSPEPGGPGNKGSASCPQTHTSETQSMTAEPAETSKIPHREKAPVGHKSLLHRLFGSNKEHHTWNHNKHRSEHENDGVLNGCTHGEASQPRPSRDIPKSKNKMKRFFRKTNIKEVTDSEHPTSSETLHSSQECTSTVPHLSTCDIRYSESRKEEADDAASGTLQATYRESDLTTNPRTESQSSSASSIPSHSARSLQTLNSQLSAATFSGRKPGDGCSLTPPLEQTSQPQVAPLPPYSEKYKEVTDSEQPTSSETPHSSQECTSTVPRLSTCDIHSSESREEEADDAASGTLQATYRESDLTSNPRTESPSSSASSIPSHGAHSLQTLNSQLSAATFSGRKPGDGCSLTSPLEQTSQPHVALLPAYSEKYKRGCTQRTQQHLPEFQRWPPSQASLASSERIRFCQRQDSLVNREEEAVQEGTSTADTLQSADEASGPCSPGQQDDLNVDDTIKLSYIEELVHNQECEEVQEGATAAQNTQSVEDSSKEIVCRPLPHFNERYTRDFTPYTQRTHQQLPTFQRLQTYQPSLASARTNFYKRQHPLVEREQDTVQEGTRTTDRLESADEASGSCSSRQQDNLNVDDTLTLSDTEELVHVQECQNVQDGATAAENTQSIKDSSKESVCRPPPHYSERYTRDFAPYTQRTHQHLPTPQGLQTYQPSLASSARTRFYQRQHPLVEREQDAVQEGTRTTETLEFCDEASDSCSSRQQDNLNVDDTLTLSDTEELVHVQECKDVQAGATAAENTQSIKDSSKESVRRPPPHYSERYTRDFVPYTPLPHQHQLILQRWQNSQPSLASSARTNFYQRQHPLVEREQDAVQEGTRTTDPLQSDDEASGSCSSRQRDNLNVDDTITLSDIEELVHKQECKEEQEGATAVRNTQFVEDSSKEIVCRPPPHYNERYTRHFAPYIQQTHQQLPAFQRCQTYQPRIPSSVWTRLHQRRHPQVERGQEAVQKGTRTTDTLESANGVQVPRSSRQQDNLNVDDTLSHIKEVAHKQEREEEQEGATAVRNTQSVEDSSKESVCRPPPHYNERYTGYYAPYTPLPHQQLPTFQRWPTYQPRQTSSARTNFYQRQHPLVEREQDAVQEENRTTDRLEACDEASGTRSSRQQDNLNVDDTMRLTNIEGQVNMQECEEGQAGATAQNTQSVEDSSKEIECRPKERLSVESSSGEEEDRCRICHSASNSTTNPLLSPCRCSGSLQFVHLDCLKTWILTKLRTRPNLHPIQRCEVCMGALVFDPDIFDLAEYCRRHNRQNPRWTGNHEARMRFLRRARQFRPPPEASDT